LHVVNCFRFLGGDQEIPGRGFRGLFRWAALIERPLLPKRITKPSNFNPREKQSCVFKQSPFDESSTWGV